MDYDIKRSGAYIRQLRIQRGFTQEMLATELNIDRSLITEEPLISMLADTDRYMLNEGFSAIVSMGTDSWNGGRLEDAEHYYDLALSMKGDDPEAMYLKARLLQSQDRITEANAIFDAIIGGHPESPYAERAMEARGY